MQQKKPNTYTTPDLKKMQEVIIDARTKIYIAVGADPEEARNRYATRQHEKYKVFASGRKPVAAEKA
jgi:hypothetical protein